MFTRDTPHCGIDSVYCVEAHFRRPLPGKRLHLRARMVYANKESGVTFGTCPLIYDSSIHSEEDGLDPTLSKKTLELFEKFLESAEKDLGELVFEHGHFAGEGGDRAEGDEGLSPTPSGLGGRQ